MGRVIGIDLGTTNTVVAALDADGPFILTDAGRPLLPSVVSFAEAGRVVVGDEARERRLIDPRNTVYSVKRLIGRSFGSEEVQRARTRFPFELREGPGHTPLVVARNETFTLPEISAFVLRKAKQVAETALGKAVDRAVITVPANFNDLQRAATKVAGRVAGLEVLRILNEPTAAALAYGLGKDRSERIAVYDFGGGTFDITLLDLAGSVFEVLATAGDTFLGGDDIDALIAERLAQACEAKHKLDPRADPVAREHLRVAAERIKLGLTDKSVFSDDFPELVRRGEQWLGLSFNFTRQDLEQLARPVISSTLNVCENALKLAGLRTSDFDQVLLVGGSTRMPLVRQLVGEFFGRGVREVVNPDQVVALGAAIQGAALTGPRTSSPPRSKRTLAPPPTDQNTSGPSATQRLPGMPAPPKISIPKPGMPRSTAAKPHTTLPSVVRPDPEPKRDLASEGSLNSAAATTNMASFPAVRSDANREELALPRAVPPGPSARKTPAQLIADIRSKQEALRQAQAQPVAAEFDVEELTPVASSQKGPAAVTQPAVTQSAMTQTNGPESWEGADWVDDFALEVPSLPPAAVMGGDALGIGVAPPAVAQRAPRVEPARVVAIGPSSGSSRLATQGEAPSTHDEAGSSPAQQFGHTLDLDDALYLPAAEVTGDDFGPATFGTERASGLTASGLATNPASTAARGAPLLIDVTPLSLAVETVGGYCDYLIPRNSPVPCAESRTFATAQDLQTTVRVRVCQGESSKFSENTLLGELELVGLPPLERGKARVVVSFELDADGILQVSAKNQATGTHATARLQLLGGSEEAHVEAMQRRQAQRSVH